MEQGRSTALEAFALYVHHERQMDKMAGGSGQGLQRPPARRHRGPPLRERGREASRGCQGGRTRAGEPVGIRGGKVPHLDWRLKSKMEFSRYHQLLLQRCRQHVILGRARANTVDFAKLVATQLVPVVHVPGRGVRRGPPTKASRREASGWCETGTTGPDRGRPMCCPVFETADEKYDRRRPSTIMPSSPVCPCPFWGVWQARRHKILFCDGMLYDQGACPPISDPRRPHGLPRKGDVAAEQGDQALRASWLS